MRCANPSRERDKSRKMYTKAYMGNFITRRTFIILEGLEGLSTSRCSHMFYTTSFRYERRRKALVFGSIFRHTRNVDTIYLDRITIRLKIKNANKVGVKLPSNS